MRRTPALLSLLLLSAVPATEAAVSSCSVDSGKPYTVYKETHSGSVAGSTCGGFYCQQPPAPSPFLRLQDPSCAGWVTESWTDFVYTTRCHLTRVDHADGTSTDYAYDCNGNLAQVWDAAHSTVGAASQTYAYDALDRLVEVRQPWGGSGGGEVVTSYGYDVQDHLVTVTDGEGNVTTYTYSDRDLLTQEVSLASGTTTHAYNEHGELVETVDARGAVATRTLDALDRVTFIDYTGTDLDVTYTYDAVPASCAASFANGRLASITRNGASIDYCHDRFGQVLQDGELTYAYDANGNRSTITYPGGVTATYGHDFADRQATLTVTTPAGTTPVVTAASWLPSGPLTALTRGNGTSEVRTYTNRYFPQTIELAAPQPLAWAYETDPMGNITRIETCAGDLELANETISTATTRTSCASLFAGPSFTVSSTGDLTLAAAEKVVLRDGFSVAEGGRLSVNVDPPSLPRTPATSLTRTSSTTSSAPTAPGASAIGPTTASATASPKPATAPARLSRMPTSTSPTRFSATRRSSTRSCSLSAAPATTPGAPPATWRKSPPAATRWTSPPTPPAACQ